MDNHIELDDIHTHIILCGATRYYMGRHTIATHAFCDHLIKLKNNLSDKTIAIIKRDIGNWLEETPECKFGCDDRECWVKVSKEFSSVSNDIK